MQFQNFLVPNVTLMHFFTKKHYIRGCDAYIPIYLSSVTALYRITHQHYAELFWFFIIEAYKFRSTFFVIDIFWYASTFKSLYFLKWRPIFDSSPLPQFLKFDNFLLACWFLAKNLSNFVSPARKRDNPYYHNK